MKEREFNNSQMIISDQNQSSLIGEG